MLEEQRWHRQFLNGQSTWRKVYLDGNDITGLSTQKVMKAGVNYVSEDRHADGIFKISSVAYNITSRVLSESFMEKFS